MRMILLFVGLLFASFSVAAEAQKKPENFCGKALEQHTKYRVSGIYGSTLEPEWHPAAAYVLLKEMQRFKVLRKEFQEKSGEWRFEFAEMDGGKIIVFVYHLERQTAYCGGPNAFFAVKKK